MRKYQSRGQLQCRIVKYWGESPQKYLPRKLLIAGSWSIAQSRKGGDSQCASDSLDSQELQSWAHPLEGSQAELHTATEGRWSTPPATFCLHGPEHGTWGTLQVLAIFLHCQPPFHTPKVRNPTLHTVRWSNKERIFRNERSQLFVVFKYIPCLLRISRSREFLSCTLLCSSPSSWTPTSSQS